MKQPDKDNMVWIDMEMTGLDPEKDGILEMATIVTDSQLNIIAEGPNLVIHQPEKTLRAMDDWNRKHHGKSGLLKAVRKSKITLRKAEQLSLDFIKKYCVPQESPLCGNSVHQDRRFLIRYMPKMDAYLHYRHVDVSTVKTLIRRWYPKGKSAPHKKDSHRALNDIRESIEELRFYRKHYFRPVRRSFKFFLKP